jgi:hypothetical protein
MNKLSDDERNPLRYYAETERIIHGSVRGTVIQGPERGTFHHHLLGMGYIEERTVDTRGAVVVLTAAVEECCAIGIGLLTVFQGLDRYASQLVAGEGVSSSV